MMETMDSDTGVKVMGTEKRQARPGNRDAWERWGWVWMMLYYAAIIFTVGLSFAQISETAVRLNILGFSGGTAVIYTLLIFLWRRERGLRERPGRTVPAVVALIILWFFLVRITPIFYFLLLGLFPSIYSLLSLSWAIVMNLLLAALIVVAQLSESGGSLSWRDPTVWAYAGIALIGVAIGVWVNAVIRQSAHRRRLIEQLEATQAELAAAERRQGVMEERARLAREIHDTLAQGFTSIVMHLEAAEGALPERPDTLRHHLNQARRTARASLDQARQVVHDLRPELLARHSLPDAIERAARRWSGETGIPVSVTVTGGVLDLHPDVDVTLLRATQEALANVRKHAAASQARLTLSYMGDMVILDVQDDGVGIGRGEASPYGGGFGLQAMRERVEQLGGAVDVESEPGVGTTVAVSIPVDGSSEQ
jgi:signal transduction histidine kinase